MTFSFQRLPFLVLPERYGRRIGSGHPKSEYNHCRRMQSVCRTAGYKRLLAGNRICETYSSFIFIGAILLLASLL